MTIVTSTTRLIESDSKVYPIFLSQLATYAPNTCFGTTVDSDLLIEFGLEVVHTVPQPAGDVITEGPPELRQDGEWYQTWISRSFDEAEQADKLLERKATLSAQAETLRVNAFATGFPYTFPGGNVYHVQVRAADRGNISDMRTIAKEMIAAGQPMMFPFRVFENIKVQLTAQEMVDLADRTFQQVVAGYQVSWDYKDAINAAATEADLPATPGAYFTL
jgi:hypothetical protein